MPIVIVAAASTIVMGLCLLLHYEVLRLLFLHSPKLKHRPRTRVCVVFGTLITTHVLEIWVFALGYFLLVQGNGIGSVQGPTSNFLDYVYFSGTVYATIVFGEYLPVGPLRFFVAMVAFVGLFMITWSAVFLFGLMHDFWTERHSHVTRKGSPP